jgi:hypothetical protein
VGPEHWKGLPGPHELTACELDVPEIPGEDLMAARTKKALVAVARRDLATCDAVGRSA